MRLSKSNVQYERLNASHEEAVQKQQKNGQHFAPQMAEWDMKQSKIDKREKQAANLEKKRD